MTRLIWKQGRPWHTAWVYSAILVVEHIVCVSIRGNSVEIASSNAAATPSALFRIDVGFAPFVIGNSVLSAFLGAQPHPRHRCVLTTGFPLLCWSILPARLPQPIPRFFSAPPKPVHSWPLKCVSEMTTSHPSQRDQCGPFWCIRRSPQELSFVQSTQAVSDNYLTSGQRGEKPFSNAAAKCSGGIFPGTGV